MSRRLWSRGPGIVGLALCLTASAAWGQVQPQQSGSQPAETTTTQPPQVPTTPVPPTPVRPLAAYPLEQLGLLAPVQQKGPATLTPSIGIAEEYNDNIRSDNANRQDDFITTFSPTISLSIVQPSYQLS